MRYPYRDRKKQQRQQQSNLSQFNTASDDEYEDNSNEKKKKGTTVYINEKNVLVSKRRQNAIKTTRRKRLVLGRLVHTEDGVNWKLGRIVYHTPSPVESESESIYFKGASGSGKSWMAYNLAGQMFFSENRTWVLMDTKFSYIGTNRPNYSFKTEIKELGGHPRGIPHTQIDIIAPYYYVQRLSAQEIRDTWVTMTYKVPLRLCTLPVMFEITKLNKKAGYASTFDQRFRDLLIRTQNRPKIIDIEMMIQNIIDDDNFSWLKRVYIMMLEKIREVAPLTLDDQDQWSSIGKCLSRAVDEKRARWIVFTLGHAENPEDDLNLAIVSTVLKEIKMFTENVRRDKEKSENFCLGVMMDELHTYVRNKDASTLGAIHDLNFAWGRTNKVVRFFLSLPPDERIWCVDPLGNLRRVPIGSLVDSVFSKNPRRVDKYPEKGYEMLEGNVNGWQVLTRDPVTLKTTVKEITGFIRHDNTETVYEIVLESGKKVAVTGYHSIFTLDAKTWRPKKVMVNMLKTGDWVEYGNGLRYENDLKKVNLIKEIIMSGAKNIESLRIRNGNYISYLNETFNGKFAFGTTPFNETSNDEETVKKENRTEEISLEQLRYVHYNGYSSPDILETYKVKIYDEKCSLSTDAIIEMTDELWEFLGMVSEIEVDETVSNHTITLKFGEKSLPIVAKALESFGIILSNNVVDVVKLERSSIGYTCTIRSSALWQFCYTAMCVSKRDLCRKAVPHIVFQQNFGAIRSYLNGLKSTSDIRYKTKDNDENRTWTYTTRSETMAHDVMQLWSKLGYHSAIFNDNRENKTYKVRTKLVSGNDGDDKNTDLHFSKIPMTLFDFNKFRNVISKNDKKKKKASSLRNRELGRIRKHIERHGYVTEKMARKIISECLAVIDNTDSLEFVRNFNALVENTEGSRYDRIARINKVENITKVYDISVEGHENFLSEDFIVCHNTQKDDQLNKTFQDDVIKKPSQGGATYQCIISCTSLPEPGFASYLNRLQADPKNPSMPIYYDKIKTVPPLFEVESDEVDNEKWKEKLLIKFANEYNMPTE